MKAATSPVPSTSPPSSVYDNAVAQLRSLNGRAEFGIAVSLVCERRQGDAKQPNPSRDRKDRFKQRVAELFELASCPDLRLTGAASRDHPEIGELDLECDRAGANTRALAMSPHLVDDL